MKKEFKVTLTSAHEFWAVNATNIQEVLDHFFIDAIHVDVDEVV